MDNQQWRRTKIMLLVITALEYTIFFPLVARWVTLFPATALDLPSTFMIHGNVTRSNAMRFAMVGILTFVPAILVGYGVSFAIVEADEFLTSKHADFKFA